MPKLTFSYLMFPLFNLYKPKVVKMIGMCFEGSFIMNLVLGNQWRIQEVVASCQETVQHIKKKKTVKLQLVIFAFKFLGNLRNRMCC